MEELVALQMPAELFFGIRSYIGVVEIEERGRVANVSAVLV
jgi:hypothetical protein